MDDDTIRNPIVLTTDASDYGIGAHLSQTINDTEYTIMLISKSLSGAQLRWSTPEKEGYAIV
jgi:hypothetical protein